MGSEKLRVIAHELVEQMRSSATVDWHHKAIRKYVNGRDLNQKSRQGYDIDLHGLDIDHVKAAYPRTHQYLLQNVKPERDQNPMDYRREVWWLFGRPGNQLRLGLAGRLDRYIGTTETSSHRLFRVVDGDTAPDQKVRVVAPPRADALAVLSSSGPCGVRAYSRRVARRRQ